MGLQRSRGRRQAPCCLLHPALPRSPAGAEPALPGPLSMALGLALPAGPSAWLMIARPPHLLQLPSARTLPGSCAPLPPQAAAAGRPAHTPPWQEATKHPWGQATLLQLKIPLLSYLHGVQTLLHCTRCHLLHATG